MNVENFSKAMNERGWIILDRALPPDVVERLNGDVGKAYEVCREIQVKNGVGNDTNGSLHHVLVLGGSFLELVEKHIPVELISNYFGGKFILNSFGGIINIPNEPTYACNAHRDIRFFSTEMPFMLTMLVMLDDFTLENGATYVLSGSHRTPEKPSDEHFFKAANRAVGKAGSLLLFDSNVWHAAGQNKTAAVRRALTLTFSKGFMKPQFDYCRALGYDYVETLSDHVKQMMGFHSRVPASLEEWYQPADKRMYKAGQD